MIRQTEIVIGAEIEDVAAILNGNVSGLLGRDDPLFFIGTGGANFVENVVEL